jgi:hypothetical protein
MLVVMNAPSEEQVRAVCGLEEPSAEPTVAKAAG